MRVTDQLPDLTRTDVGVALSDEWVLGTPDRQRAAAEALVAAWREVAWPAGLLSYAIYLDTDGELIRHYSQWTDDAAADAFVRAGQASIVDRTDAVVPGIDRRDLARYRIYRGNRADDGRVPGAVVAVRVDAESADQARVWVDAVFDALAADDHLPAGGIGGFFHISTDGSQVLNYAEWTSPEAHLEALAANGDAISSGPLWARVWAMDGVRQVSVRRYRLYRTLTK
ncbi:antibiotic biosynthesis monooxygenase [Micromonospora pisi]|uniref:Antibiotic biosynthesis monooxygenase n=1 Tax=Micromonospora pisi TaxID=589240 RepID=A0A495JT34_9ACTN|nr:antibiotic biosynthesis monooxygenase [Micromonospora pisi]RKR92157.1 antibiotic biosynthesis monooxygenase [Micromonospora pisi]